MKLSLLFSTRRLIRSSQRFNFSRTISSTRSTYDNPVNSWTKYSRTNIDVHEAGHAAYSLSFPSYLPFQYTLVHAPDSKKFREGIYGVTCYNPDKALALPIRKGNEYFIKFSLAGKIAEKIIGSEVQHGIENNASGDILSVLIAIRENRYNQREFFLERQQLENITEINGEEESFLDNKMQETVEFIFNSYQLNQIIQIMLSVQKSVDVSDIWDIFLHGKNQFPEEFIEKMKKEQIPIPDLKTELLIPDYLSNQLTFRNFFASELNQISASQKAANEKILDNHQDQENKSHQESKDGNLQTETEMSLI